MTPSSQATPRTLALRVATMPRDTNQYGTIFGGVVLAYMDQAAFVQARGHGRHRWVTAAIDRLEFRAPIQVGDIVNLYTSTIKTGRTSATIRVEVEAERYTSGATVAVTEATFVMVSVDAAGQAIPFAGPPTVGA